MERADTEERHKLKCQCNKSNLFLWSLWQQLFKLQACCVKEPFCPCHQKYTDAVRDLHRSNGFYFVHRLKEMSQTPLRERFAKCVGVGVAPSLNVCMCMYVFECACKREWETRERSGSKKVTRDAVRDEPQRDF